MDKSNDPNDKGFTTGEDNFSGGFAIVGEPGPELPYLPPGTTIVPNPIAPLAYSFSDYVNNVIASRWNNPSGSTEIRHVNIPRPEMIFIPPNPAFGYLEIVRAVAETDSIFHTTTDYDDVPCGWCCPFCTGYIRGRRHDVPEFPHDDDCIVLKARAMVEAMPDVEAKQ
jgi:hypothetical protein